MPLITKVQELRSMLPRLLSTLSDNSNLPAIPKAQRKYITPLLGKALMADLEERYEENTLGEDEELLKFIQLPLAAYAILDDLAFIQSTVTDNGIRTASTDKMQAAHRWEYNEIRNTLQDYAIDGVEQLLDYLFDNKETYPLWTASQEYTFINNSLIKSGSDFAKQYPLYQPLYTYWTLRPLMLDVEENYLIPALGRQMVSWVKAQETVEITTEGGLVDVKKLLKKAVAFLTIKHACEHFTPRFGRSGFTVLYPGGNPDDESNTGFSAASAAEIQQKKDACDRDGQNYLSKASRFVFGIGRGLYEDFDADFTAAFELSPLNTPIDADPWTNGNERRKLFRF